MRPDRDGSILIASHGLIANRSPLPSPSPGFEEGEGGRARAPANVVDRPQEQADNRPAILGVKQASWEEGGASLGKVRKAGAAVEEWGDEETRR